MSVLCIKPGRFVGWAVHNGYEILRSGSDEYCPDIRVAANALRRWIKDSIMPWREIEQIVHEERKIFHPACKMQCDVLRKMHSRPVTPATVKRAVGLPLATPNDMIKYTRTQFPSANVQTFEHAFALCMTQI